MPIPHAWPDASSLTGLETITATQADGQGVTATAAQISEYTRATWPLHPGVRTSVYYLAASVTPSSAVATVATNSIYYQPISLVGSLNRIGIEITTGAAGACRLGLYTNNAGVPGTLILDCGTVDTTSIAIVEATFAAQTLKGEWVWMASVFNATPTCRAGVAGGQSGIMGSSTPSAGIRSLLGSLTYGALPTTAPAVTFVSSVGPAVFLRSV